MGLVLPALPLVLPDTFRRLDKKLGPNHVENGPLN